MFGSSTLAVLFAIPDVMGNGVPKADLNPFAVTFATGVPKIKLFQKEH